jgi:SAM-dependent methyltransferase
MLALIHGLQHRRRQPEIMDQPDLDSARHFEALRGLERINRLSGSSGILWPQIRALAQAAGTRSLRVLDIATGAGDVAIRLWERGRRAGLTLHVAGCDISSQALEFARQRAGQRRADVQFFSLDVLKGELPLGYDVVVSSLFLHHLEEEEAVGLMHRMGKAASRSVMVNDLRRGFSGYLLARLGTRLLSASDVVHVDGPRSVEAAWTVREMQTLARAAGLAGATVENRWPCRMLLSWSRT